MNTLRVELGARAYDIHIGQGLLRSPGIWSALPLGQDVLIVSDDNVAAHYSETVEHALAGHNAALHVVTPGEQTKQLSEVARVIDQLVAHGARRDATLLALGGGVVGDLSGFAAACYMRGIDFVQLPTSLLAQVDSSVGGKTGVNHPAGKNLIGAFHQPAAVIIDTDTLTTLPDRELSAGLAEVIKTALLADGAFFDWLENNMVALRAREPEALATAIRRCCEIKAAVVARDEREAGERMLLNLGHTFGHAIEKVTGYSQWLHGEAVGTGLVMAAHLSALRGELSETAVHRVASVVEAANLPLNTHGLTPSALREAMGHDKKFKHGQTRFILLRELGQAWVCEDVDSVMLDNCLESFCA
jgi:3-dehydroquinate synthase